MDDLKFCTTDYDKQLREISDLKWLPWIGLRYDQTRIVVLGESQYDDEDDWQNNFDATRISIGCQFSGGKGKLCSNVEKVLLSTDNVTLAHGNYIWKSVAYMNLVQRLMPSRNDRPDDTDFDNGWKMFFELVDVMKPSICIVLGKSSCGRLGYYLTNNDLSWERNVPEFYATEKIINLSKKGHNLKLIFINHPSGSWGFDYVQWARLVSENAPQLYQMLQVNDL